MNDIAHRTIIEGNKAHKGARGEKKRKQERKKERKKKERRREREREREWAKGRLTRKSTSSTGSCMNLRMQKQENMDVR